MILKLNFDFLWTGKFEHPNFGLSARSSGRAKYEFKYCRLVIDDFFVSGQENFIARTSGMYQNEKENCSSSVIGGSHLS